MKDTNFFVREIGGATAVRIRASLGPVLQWVPLPLCLLSRLIRALHRSGSPRHTLILAATGSRQLPSYSLHSSFAWSSPLEGLGAIFMCVLGVPGWKVPPRGEHQQPKH